MFGQIAHPLLEAGEQYVDLVSFCLYLIVDSKAIQEMYEGKAKQKSPQQESGSRTSWFHGVQLSPLNHRHVQ